MPANLENSAVATGLDKFRVNMVLNLTVIFGGLCVEPGVQKKLIRKDALVASVLRAIIIYVHTKANMYK